MIREFKDAKPVREKPARTAAKKRPARQSAPTKQTRANVVDKTERRSFRGPNISKKTVLAIVLIAVIAIGIATAAAILIPVAISHGEQVKEIAISKLPDKTTYFVGEKPNYDGLRVLVTRNNGETFIVRAQKCEFSGFNTDIAVEKCIITVSYEGKEAIFSMTVKEVPKPDPVLKSIRLDSVPKTEYKVGEWLDVSGGYLIIEYLDGSSVRVNLLATDIVEDWNKIKNVPGEHTLTVKYSENGVRATTTYTITVTE